MRFGDEDQNPGSGENQEFVISENEMQAPEEVVNAPEGEIPDGAAVGDAFAPLPEGADFTGDQFPAADFAGLPEGSDLLPDPNENPDPALAVEEMLTAAVLPEGEAHPDLGLLGEIAPPDAVNLPTFQLQFGQLGEDEMETVKGLAAALNLEATEGADHPLLSKLTEFQALALRQAALAEGIAVKVAVSFPLPQPTEEDEALGNLSAVPEDAPILTEGAPAVELPRHEKEVLLLSGETGGLVLREGKGIITAHRSIARRFFREEEAQENLQKEMRRLPGGRQAPLPASRVERVFRELFLELQKAALARGANAVTGVRLEAFPESVSLDPELEQLRLVAFGTAAVVEKA